MARTARLVPENHLIKSGVTITASSSQFGKPATNLASPLPWQSWSSIASVGDQWVLFDLGVPKTFQVIQLVKYVAHASGSVRLQANNVDSWGAPSVNLSIPLPEPNYTRCAGLWLDAAVSYRYIRILFQNTIAVNQQVSVGVIIAGTYFQPAISLAPGYGITRVDPSQVNRVPGGQRFTDRKQQYFQIKGTFDKEPETDRPSFLNAFSLVGTHTPFIFAINPDNQGYFVFYGRFEGGFTFDHITVGRFGAPFTFF